jgi:DNA polymerase-3 subunit gamma/tau
MSYIVTARKWRPLLFKDVVAQEHVTQTLKNAILNDRIHHAYLFSGPRGVGKTTTARILARAVNCENSVDAEPCNQCLSCTSILEGKSLDVMEIDGASNNSVEDIRKLRENAKYSPSSGKYKMYIIDEVHMLSTSAFNALLKILEEPPPHLMFVFATTEPHKVPATILSRCQRHEFKRIEPEDIIRQLRFISEQESINIDEDSLATIAKKADGSMRDAQSILDQVIAFAGTDINYTKLIDALHLIDNDFYFRISRAGFEKNTNEMLKVANDVSNKGYDLQEVLSGLMEHYRNLLTVKVTGNSKLIESSDTFKQKYEEDAVLFTKEDLLRILNLIAATEQSLRFSPQPKIRFELLLIQISSMDSAVELKELISALRSGKNPNVVQKPVTKPKSTVNDTKVQYVPAKKSDEPIKKNIKASEKAPAPKVIAKANTKDVNENQVKETTGSDLKSRWDTFIGKYANATTGLSMLKGAWIENVEFTDKDVIIYTNAALAYDSLMKKKRDLTQHIIDFAGKNYSVKIINAESNKSSHNPPAINKQTADNSSKKQNNIDLQDLHPVEKSIVDLFNAKRI